MICIEYFIVVLRFSEELEFFKLFFNGNYIFYYKWL